MLVSFSTIESNAQAFDTLLLYEEQFILFESNQWTVDESINDKLDSLLSIVAMSDSIFLEGHTDEVGSQRFNQKLSAKRVSSVKELLLESGIDEDKIQTKAFGELMPASIGASESAYQLNRRVSIRCYKSRKMRTIKGQIVDEESGEGLKALVKLTGKNFMDSTYTRDDGKYSIAAPDKGIYKFEVSADSHFFEQRYIKISPLEPIEFNIKLPEIKMGGVYKIPNLNFVGGVPLLVHKSLPTLKLLYGLLSNSSYCLEIGGHVNVPNAPHCEKSSDHYKLSVDRAEMVFVEMVKEGIDPKRMLVKGYGNWQMLYPKANTYIEMEENRRVEIKIIDCNSEELLQRHQRD